jgi:hypothetical protein
MKIKKFDAHLKPTLHAELKVHGVKCLPKSWETPFGNRKIAALDI